MDEKELSTPRPITIRFTEAGYQALLDLRGAESFGGVNKCIPIRFSKQAFHAVLDLQHRYSKERMQSVSINNIVNETAVRLARVQEHSLERLSLRRVTWNKMINDIVVFGNQLEVRKDELDAELDLAGE